MDIVLQHKTNVCAGALALAESFMLRSFLDLGKQQLSAVYALTVPKKYAISVSLGDPEFFSLQAQIFLCFQRKIHMLRIS